MTTGDELMSLLVKAQKMYHAGHFSEALGVSEEALGHQPEQVDALNMAAVSALQIGDLGRALEYLDKAIVSNPSHPQAYLNLGVILEQNGRTEEAANAYRASLEADPDQILARLNLGNALAQLGHNQAAIESCDLVLAQEPANTDALNNKGMALKAAGRIEDAETTLREAVRVAPNSDQSWLNLGLVLRLGAKPEEALTAYERALEINPTSIKALNNLAVLHRWEGRLNEAEAICQGVLKTHSNVVEVLNNLGDILQAQGRVDEARTMFERVLEIDPAHPEGHHNLAVLLLLRGDFEAGWQHYEWRWLAKEFPSERRNFSQPLWMGEELTGKTILLYVEQGLGDALQFVRYAPLVHARGGRVVVECPASLKRLFETVEGIDRVIARGGDLGAFDLQCPFLSLPGLLSPRAEDIPATVPYLFGPDEELERWRARLEGVDGFKVGLVWAGSPHHTNDRERSITLDTLTPLSEVPGCAFINLQIGPSTAQLADVSWPVVDLTQDVGDYADTAALVGALDLVITVDTSVAHVAGALGKPVWVLLPHAPDWRWQLEREDSPWYPSMKLYRQPLRRDWQSVLQRVKSDLKDVVGPS